MASGHGANIGLGSGLGGAPAINNATRFDVWPPCGHRQRLVKGGAICSPPADDAIGTGTASGGGTGRAGRWSQAVVADHAPLRRLPATSCRKLQSGTPSSTSAPPSYLFNPLLRLRPDEQPAGGPAHPQSAVRHCTLLGVGPSQIMQWQQC